MDEIFKLRIQVKLKVEVEVAMRMKDSDGGRGRSWGVIWKLVLRNYLIYGDNMGLERCNSS